MDRVTLEPDRRAAALWTALGLVATTLAAHAFASADSVLFPGLLVLACALTTGVFGLQLLAPEAWTLEVDRSGVHGTLATFSVEEAFDRVRAVELWWRGGDPLLVLLRTGDRRALLLPVGCDLDALRALVRDIERDRSRGL